MESKSNTWLVVMIIFFGHILLYTIAYFVSNSIFTNAKIIDTKPIRIGGGYLISSNIATNPLGNSTEDLQAAKKPLPSQAQTLLLLISVLVFGICVAFSLLVKKLFHIKRPLITSAPIHEFTMLHGIPIAAILILVYLTCDSLISLFAYLVILVFLLYFRNYTPENYRKNS